MDSERTGKLLWMLRTEKGMTQRQLAERLQVSDKAVSKWERGAGGPDISLLPRLAEVLEIEIENLLSGELGTNDIRGENMKRTKYYVCPLCGNISICTGEAAVSCCGRRLTALVPQQAQPQQQLTVEAIEDEWYITSDHPMRKEDYISFVAFVSGGRMQFFKQYPEWKLEMRMQRCGHGMLLWYSAREGLLSQII